MNMVLLYMHAITAHIPACQKTASYPIIGGCEPPCGCWDLNSGPLEELPMLLTVESSL